MELKNKTAIVTGSTRGIGKAIAEGLALKGANVVINGRNSDQVNEVVKELSEKYEGDFLGLACDVCIEEQVSNLVTKTLEKWEAIDVLVNNAGINKDNLILRMKSEDWDKVLEVNLKSYFLMSKAVVRSMLRQKSGKIINISSVVGQMGNAGQTNYCASKGGIISFTKALAKEVASKNITVNAIAPGFIETQMTHQMSDDAKETIAKNIPLKKLGSVEDIAMGVGFLASNSANYITGHVLSINGGLFM